MTPAGLSFILGGAAVALHLLGSVWLLRRAPGKSPIVLHLVSAVVAEASFVAVAVSIEPAVHFWHGSSLLGTIAVMWMFCFSAVYKSVSLKMLARLRKGQGACRSLKSLNDEVGVTEFDSRIAVLENMGLVRNTGATYETTRSGRVFNARFSAVRNFFGIRNRGYYDREPTVSK